MDRPTETSVSSVGALVALLTGAIFAVDAFVPLGFAVWALYPIPVVLSLLSTSRRLPIVVAVAATVLIVIGFFLSPPSGLGSFYVQTNRVLCVAMLWTVAAFAQRFARSKSELAATTWVRAGHSQVGARLQGELSPSELGDGVLDVLCALLDAPVGVLYVHGDDGSLHRTASFALPANGATPETIAPGEGLVGQAIKSGRLLRLTDVPSDYLLVGSGLGTRKPHEIVVVPILVEGEAVGAIELGLTRELDRAALELLELVAEPIGIAIRSLHYRTRLEALLAETQRQADELSAQEEELRAANETLQEAHARLEEQQAELEQTNAALEEQSRTLEQHHGALSRAQSVLVDRADELARANQYKSEFLANMSHELRTPLNSALILSNLLAENREGNLTEEQVRYARSIHDAGSDLLTLINDILDLSRIEAGRMDVRPEPMEVSRIVEAVRGIFVPIAEDRGVSLLVRVRDDAPRAISSDAVRLQQILRNLLSNAVKFTPPGGEVRLEVGAREGERITFAVRDSGPGIPSDQHEIIFEAFRQARGSTYEGTGLGLTISRELARRLGGDIELVSAPAQGSTFTLVLPREAPSEARAVERVTPTPVPAAPEPAPAPAPLVEDDRDVASPARTILVIEDDVRFAEALRDLARARGFRCLVATTAAEGMRLAQRHAPSGIVLDILLPDDSGLGVLEQLKRDPATRHVPVHVVSAADHARRALAMGAIGYALKPVDRDQLVEAFARIERQLETRVRKVLVVEDDEAQRRHLVELLSADDVEVVAVASGGEALRALEQTSFDCMVLDLVLPDIPGLEVLGRMAGGSAASFPPVIVHTSRQLSRDEEQELRRHASSIVVKGARSPERLLDEVMLFLHQVESGLAPDKQRMLREVRSRDAVLEGRRVLVVDDDVRNVFALSSVLEPLGMRVEIARNGREALEALERASASSGRIDIVLMDIMMPEMDGLTAMRAIRERSAWRELPILALTAKAMPDDRASAIEAGANDYITMPLDVDRLLSLIRVWLPK